jgi:hypothetical protein
MFERGCPLWERALTLAAWPIVTPIAAAYWLLVGIFER